MLSFRVVVAVVVRPWLWRTAIVQAIRLCPSGWWKTRPRLPIPRPEYLEFRLVTQYGGDPDTGTARIRAEDVVDYLQWCRNWNDGR